jgi:uncharacterized protein with HEPN domain
VSSRENLFFLFDLYASIGKIEYYVAEIEDAHSFQYDCKTWDAVMHEFAIMGESAKHLIEKGILDQKERPVVNFRNLIVHHYFGLDGEEVLETIQSALPPFKERIKTRIESIEPMQREKLLEQYLENFPQPMIREIFDTL